MPDDRVLGPDCNCGAVVGTHRHGVSSTTGFAYPAPAGDATAEAQLVPCWHCGDDVPIDTADVHLAASGVAWVCKECEP